MAREAAQWKSLGQTYEHTRVIMKCYSGCKNASTLQRGQYQLRADSKSVVGVIQKAVPDDVATTAPTDGRLIWATVWTRSTYSLAQITPAQCSLSGSHLGALQHVWVAPIYLWHHYTALEESRGPNAWLMNLFFPRGQYQSFSVLDQRKKPKEYWHDKRSHIYLFSS